jgi:alpha-glucosidase/alpha-D-xyloside xylohydrolase
MGPSEDRVPPLESELNNPAIEPIAKKYDELHYQLLPYTYTLAWEARYNGLPLMRSMWLHYPQDEKASALGKQYLWGRDLLIAPVFEKGASTRDVYLPQGDWYDWWDLTKESGGKTVTRKVDLSIMPIYVRAGAIIPFDPVRQYTAGPIKEPTTIKIFSGADGEYTLYEDDGISQEYLQKRGSWTKFTWKDEENKLTIEAGAPKGFINDVKQRAFQIEILPDGRKKNIVYNGKAMNVIF